MKDGIALNLREMGLPFGRSAAGVQPCEGGRQRLSRLGGSFRCCVGDGNPKSNLAMGCYSCDVMGR